MKQKLTRALIDEIRKEMPVLSQNEEKGVIGGTLYVIGVDGRVLYSNETNTDEVLVSMGSWDGAPTMELPKGHLFKYLLVNWLLKVLVNRIEISIVF